jgi:hypothetical protein
VEYQRQKRIQVRSFAHKKNQVGQVRLLSCHKRPLGKQIGLQRKLKKLLPFLPVAFSSVTYLIAYSRNDQEKRYFRSQSQQQQREERMS